MSYVDFLDYKTHRGAEQGFSPVWMPAIPV